MSAAPILTTERLELRPQVPGDLAGLVRLVADPETTRFLGEGRNNEADQFARLLRNGGSWHWYGYGGFAVRLRGQQDIIASGGLFRSWRPFGERMQDVTEAGWVVRHDHTGKGIAREFMAAVMDWFDAEHGSQRVTCMIDEGNAASLRLAARLGFAEYARAPADDGAPLIFFERHGPA